MKKISFLLALIMSFVMLAPVGIAESALVVISRDENGVMTLSGNTSAGEKVTLRSIYFGEDKPDFPKGIGSYEISAEEVQSGSVNMNYFNICIHV